MPIRLPCLPIAAALIFGTPLWAVAQDNAPVSPVSAPIPLPGVAPVAPPLLRTKNPAVLPMTGTWRFSLTHGGIVAGGKFVPRSTFAAASSEEGGNGAEKAFDGASDTRWCASGDSFPQWVQADLGAAQVVKGIDLTWERPTGQYKYRIEGSQDGVTWLTIGTQPAGAGTSDGPATMASSPMPCRYVRVFVTAAADGHWASLRECKITVAQPDGTALAWKHSTAVLPDAVRDEFAAPDFKDAQWHDLGVPSNWEMAGYSIPTYNSVDDTVGLYRRVVDVPASFAGKRILWRFDGVLEGAEVWINGRRAGYHESGYTAWDIDITDFVKAGSKNLFAVRVSKTAPSVDCETGDFQCMGGIFRENYLIALPSTHVQKLIVTTKLDATYRDAILGANITITGTPGDRLSVSGELVGPGGTKVAVSGLMGEAAAGPDGMATISISAPVARPLLWSAEKPNLYYLVLKLSTPGKPETERVEQRFGFRQIDIKNGVVLWNGAPIKCMGVCRHDEWADKGFALTEENWRKDLQLMRGANVNAIRTSHYNHAERFLELCDEMGFYVLDEVPFCWLNQNFSKPEFIPYLVQRAQETVARDRNRACVLAWSLGNENGHGDDGQAVMDCVTALDSTRPAFVSQMWSGGYKGQAFRDNHYPVPADIVSLTSQDGGVSAPASLSEHPHMFYQKEALDYDPGVSDLWGDALQSAWDLIWPQPTILGAFIWEWQNQGIADPNPDKTRDFYYGPDHLRQENNKGLVDAYRKPKVELAYVRQVYSPVGISAGIAPAHGSATVTLTNRYSFTNLGELTCRWTAIGGERALQHGERHIDCPPAKSIDATFAAPAGTTSLRLDFVRADGSPVIGATLPAAGYAAPRPGELVASSAALTVEEQADEVRIHTGHAGLITFDRLTGRLRSWTAGKRKLLSDGPVMNFGETRARGGAPKDYLYSEQPAVTAGSRLTWTRTPDSVTVTTTARVNGSATEHPDWGSLFTTYTVHPGGAVDVSWALYWKSNTPAHAWEAGLRMTAPKDLSKIRWSRHTLFTDFPAGHPGAPTGQSTASEQAFRGSKRDLDYLSLTDASGAGLVLAEDGGALIGRATPMADGMALFASHEVAGPRDLSYPYIAAHDIVLTKESSIEGKFCLYPTGI